MKKKTVSIVGGGLAGLLAAYTLLKNDHFDVTVFEEKPFLGGRIQSRQVLGHSIDFGGFLIYPWYEKCHSILEEFAMADQLIKTPLKDIYYVLEPGGSALKVDEIPFSTLEGLEIWSKSLFKILPDADVSAPMLDSFGRKTISDYLRETLVVKGHAGLYETFFDIVNQGYCYGPVDKTKAAFMAPIVRQTTFYGDIRSTSFFPEGAHVLIDRLTNEISARGGHIHLNSPVVEVDGLTLKTKTEEHESGAIIFAQNVSGELYRQIMPDVIPDCWYTRFFTAAVQLDARPLVHDSEDWGAIFYASDGSGDQQILSAINLPTLYGEGLEKCVMVNVLLRNDEGGAMNDATIGKKLEEELCRLFPNCKTAKVLEAIHWTKTMPVAQEAFVEAVREKQGKGGYFFAGDFLGAPSIETAIATGLSAAEQLLSMER